MSILNQHEVLLNNVDLLEQAIEALKEKLFPFLADNTKPETGQASLTSKSPFGRDLESINVRLEQVYMELDALAKRVDL